MYSISNTCYQWILLLQWQLKTKHPINVPPVNCHRNFSRQVPYCWRTGGLKHFAHGYTYKTQVPQSGFIFGLPHCKFSIILILWFHFDLTYLHSKSYLSRSPSICAMRQQTSSGFHLTRIITTLSLPSFFSCSFKFMISLSFIVIVVVVCEQGQRQ